MLRLAGEREAVQVVDDQVGSPDVDRTPRAGDARTVERGVRGLVHLAGAGAVSWNGFAKEIFRQAEVKCRVEAIASAEMAVRRRGRRSRCSTPSARMCCRWPAWRDGLAGYLGCAGWDDEAMRLLVCGGAGFIGSNFMRLRLREDGDRW